MSVKLIIDFDTEKVQTRTRANVVRQVADLIEREYTCGYDPSWRLEKL